MLDLVACGQVEHEGAQVLRVRDRDVDDVVDRPGDVVDRDRLRQEEDVIVTLQDKVTAITLPLKGPVREVAANRDNAALVTIRR